MGYSLSRPPPPSNFLLATGLPITIVRFKPLHSLMPSCVYLFVFFFCRLVEYDSNIHEEVSKMSRLIVKLLFITDRCQSEPAGYALCSSQDASNNLLCCTWNVRSAQPLMDCGKIVEHCKKCSISHRGF